MKALTISFCLIILVIATAHAAEKSYRCHDLKGNHSIALSLSNKISHNEYNYEADGSIDGKQVDTYFYHETDEQSSMQTYIGILNDFSTAYLFIRHERTLRSRTTRPHYPAYLVVVKANKEFTSSYFHQNKIYMKCNEE